MNITLEHLTKRFPARGRKSQGEVTAVQDLSFQVPDGTLVGLLGPSGCGKSTTLNMICGLETPTEGKILFGEEDVTALAPELRGVGMVFQNYALYPHLTVLQNILFPLENLKGRGPGPPGRSGSARALEAARLVQIEELLDRKPKELSGGQQQRVAIARALVKTPRVLLLDEPLSNLDARLRLQTREEIVKIQKKTGITTLFVTHDQEEAMSISDRIVVMKDGVLMQQGAPQEVYDDPHSLFVAKFLGTPPINVFEGTVKAGPAVSRRAGGAGGARRGRTGTSGWASGPEGFVPQAQAAPDAAACSGWRCWAETPASCAPTRPARAPPCGPSSGRRSGWTGAAAPCGFSLRPEKVFLFQKGTEERMPSVTGKGVV